MTDQYQHAIAPSTIRSLSFGVGCWDFGIRFNPGSTVNADTYIAALEKGLESISSLNNISIFPKPYNPGELTVNTTTVKQQEGPVIFSHSFVSGICFDLYIPVRIQEKVVPNGIFHASDTQTENFRVHVYHAYHSAVTFVELVGAPESPVPSTAMVIIRKYLEERCRESSCELEFRYVGPTPFHVNFFLESDLIQREGSTFGFREVKKPGYSDIIFSYCKSSFEGVQDALEDLFIQLTEELGLFYLIQTLNSKQYECWDEIEKLLYELTRHTDATDWGRLGRGTHGNLEALSVALAQFKADQIRDEYAVGAAFRHIYGKGLSTFLQPSVEAEIAERPVFPTGPTTDLLAFIETRRSKALDWPIASNSGGGNHWWCGRRGDYYVGESVAAFAGDRDGRIAHEG